MAEPERRRRRLRHGSSGGGNGGAGGANSTGGSGPPSRAAETSATHDPAPEPGRRGPEPATPTPAPSAAEERDGERGLRGLVGSGSSQVSLGAALRARDAARPTDAHLAQAEQNLVLVRRNWVPREELPRTGR